MHNIKNILTLKLESDIINMQGDLSPIMGRGGTMHSKTRVAAYCRVSTDMEDQLH